MIEFLHTMLLGAQIFAGVVSCSFAWASGARLFEYAFGVSETYVTHIVIGDEIDEASFEELSRFPPTSNLDH